MSESIVERYQRIRGRIDRAAESCGREPGDVTLVAVSKTFPAEVVAGLAGVGPAVLGESRVQEAAGKVAALAGLPFTWHLVGHLQSNKANRAAELFSMIHSVDDVALLQRLERRCAELGKDLDVLVEVNLGGEDSKSGCTSETVPAILDAACGLQRVRVRGLMTLPPWCDEPEDARPFFARLRELRDRLVPRYAGALDLTELSMGMSHDFEAAVAEGATLVRVGTAIFGSR